MLSLDLPTHTHTHYQYNIRVEYICRPQTAHTHIHTHTRACIPTRGGKQVGTVCGVDVSDSAISIDAVWLWRPDSLQNDRTICTILCWAARSECANVIYEFHYDIILQFICAIVIQRETDWHKNKSCIDDMLDDAYGEPYRFKYTRTMPA